MANKTASFTMPGVMPPYGADMAASQMEQQQLVEALAQVRGQGPTQPINAGRFSALNFEGVGNTIREAMLQKRQDVARKKAADLQGSYNKDLLRDLQAYTANRDGGEVPVAGPPEAGAASPTRSTPSNPLAFKSGQLSQFPEIRSAAEEDRKSHEAVYGKLLEKASPNSAFAADGNPRLLRPKVDQFEANGAIFERGQEVGQAPTLLPGMGVTQEKIPGLGNVNKMPGGKVDTLDKRSQVIVSTGQKADQAFLEAEAKSISANRVKLEETVPQQMRALASAEEAAASGAYQGPVSGFVAGAAGLLRQLNMAPEETQRLLTNTQTLDSDMGRFVLQALKATGTNPSNTDLKYAEVTAGNKKLSPEGLVAVIKSARVDIANSLITHNKRIDAYSADIPHLAGAKLPVPKLSPAQGYVQDPENGLYAPAKRPTAGSARYTPEQLKRLRDLGVTPLEN